MTACSHMGKMASQSLLPGGSPKWVKKVKVAAYPNVSILAACGAHMLAKYLHNPYLGVRGSCRSPKRGWNHKCGSKQCRFEGSHVGKLAT